MRKLIPTLISYWKFNVGVPQHLDVFLSVLSNQVHTEYNFEFGIKKEATLHFVSIDFRRIRIGSISDELEPVFSNSEKNAIEIFSKNNVKHK